MTGWELTRRKFMEIAGAAMTASRLEPGKQPDALTLHIAGSDGHPRRSVPMNRNWRFLRQASLGRAVEAQFAGVEKSGYNGSPHPPCSCRIRRMSAQAIPFLPEAIFAKSDGIAPASTSFATGEDTVFYQFHLLSNGGYILNGNS